MADKTNIEWTDATWNPITGCSVISAGCKHCYAMNLAGTRMKHHWSRIGLTVDTKAGPVWTGEVRFNEEWLDQPLRWKAAREIFVCAHADLFHDSVPFAWIDQVFAVMAMAPQHRFQVLTKRSARMRAYFDGLPQPRWLAAIRQMGLKRGTLDPAHGAQLSTVNGGVLPNVWLGVSIEDRNALIARAADLMATRAVVRWWSAEPLLGDLGSIPPELMPDWIVAGGESGNGARPMHVAWARSLRDQCAAAGVPFFFKQWGEYLPAEQVDATRFEWCPGTLDPNVHWWDGAPPEDLQARPNCSMKVGKRQAGRLLDGVQHDGRPA